MVTLMCNKALFYSILLHFLLLQSLLLSLKQCSVNLGNEALMNTFHLSLNTSKSLILFILSSYKSLNYLIFNAKGHSLRDMRTAPIYDYTDNYLEDSLILILYPPRK